MHSDPDLQIRQPWVVRGRGGAGGGAAVGAGVGVGGQLAAGDAAACAAETLAEEKHMLLILNFSTLTFITNARTTMPFARLHFQMVCTQSEPAEIPQHMFVQILVQVEGDRKRRTSVGMLESLTC